MHYKKHQLWWKQWPNVSPEPNNSLALSHISHISEVICKLKDHKLGQKRETIFACGVLKICGSVLTAVPVFQEFWDIYRGSIKRVRLIAEKVLTCWGTLPFSHGAPEADRAIRAHRWTQSIQTLICLFQGLNELSERSFAKQMKSCPLWGVSVSPWVKFPKYGAKWSISLSSVKWQVTHSERETH